MRTAWVRYDALLLAALLSLTCGCRKTHRVFAVRLPDHKPVATAARFQSRYSKHRRGAFQMSRRRFRRREGRTAPLDVNRASLGELMRLPGMRRREAERIMRARPLANKRVLLLRALVSPAQYRHWASRLVARQSSAQP